MLLIDQINELCERQLRDWQLVRDNYAALDNLLTRELWLHNSEGKLCSRIILQHNPARVRSTAADLSDEAIAARPCFLCDVNQPAEQEAVLWTADNELQYVNDRKRQYKIQVNPYPIFKRHLTISLVEHKPQFCYYRDMLELAQQLPEHVIMFNGAGCGASAPDHLHFQATMQQELPLCQELEARTISNLSSCYGTNNLWMDNDTGRQLIYARPQILDSAILSDMGYALRGGRRNALCWHKDGTWHFVYFPRNFNRPACYGDGEEQYLVSPATAEYGGVWVLPRKKDFDNLNAELISAIYKELSYGNSEMSSIYDRYVRFN